MGEWEGRPMETADVICLPSVPDLKKLRLALTALERELKGLAAENGYSLEKKKEPQSAGG